MEIVQVLGEIVKIINSFIIIMITLGVWGLVLTGALGDSLISISAIIPTALLLLMILGVKVLIFTPIGWIILVWYLFKYKS